MKGGKVFNTETAEMIAHYDNGLGSRDFRNLSEGLYITKKGNYFLAGDGGPMTKYAEPCGSNSWGGGSGIEHISKSEALEWCEMHEIDADIIAKYFDVEEA